jgi:tight adherence protein C
VRYALAALLPLWCGATLLLSELRWFAPSTMADRLRPFALGGPTPSRRSTTDVALGDVARSFADTLGSAMSRCFHHTDLAGRLAQARWDTDVTMFRVRQAAHAAAALVATVLIVGSGHVPLLPAVGAVAAVPVVAHQWTERRLSRACRARSDQLLRELPSFAEQVATLLGSGWSLGGALQRVAESGSGAVARDVAEVSARIGHGIADTAALREWADRSSLPALDRLVSVLELNRMTADLGRLLAAETRTMREERHRELIAELEQRAQQVWIPVTVATLVPGSIFLAIPFLEALRLFTAP